MADNDPFADPFGVGLDGVQSLEAFARACDRLRAGRSYTVLGKAARPRLLPPATLSDLLRAKSTPTRDTMITFLIACGLDEAAQRPWLAAWERVATAHQPRPVGAVRVREARPRLLGVHAAIQLPGTAEELPPYVPRDLDADLRADLTAAAAQGGFVLLLGGSSVGKTRALYEAVRAELPEWWLLHPTDTPTADAHAAAPTPRTVMWLDELQRYLNHRTGLPAGALRQLITAGTVVVATLWPDEYHIRIARPSVGQPDPYANDRDLLGFAQLIEVPETFSRAERRRGETLAGTDQRIRIALDTTDAGFTQVVAAGPALIRRWEHAPDDDCYGKAVITAVLDAHRVGAHQPATNDFLQAAAPAYLTPAQQANAPRDWLDRGLAYATTPVHRATACLTPVPASMGLIAGYTTSDYLRQHAQRTCRTAALPEPVWQALIAHHHHPDDTARLFDNARRRGQPNHAIALYLRADATPRNSFGRALIAAGIDLLAEQGRIDALRDLAATGNQLAVDRLAGLLAEQGCLDELRDLATTGNGFAVDRLVDLLAEQGHIDEALQALRNHAATGDWHAAGRLADLLAEQGRIDELRDLATTGRWTAAERLARLLAEQGRIDELRDLAATGNEFAVERLAGLLAEQGRLDEALQALRNHAATGNEFAAARLVDLLAEQGRLDEALQALRSLAATGNEFAVERLAGLLAEQGRLDEALQALRDLAATGNGPAAARLVDLLAEQGRLDELRDLAATGNEFAAERLARLLAEQGRIDELRDLAATSDWHAAERLARLLAEQGRLDEALQALRDLAATGNGPAAARLVDLLAEQGRLDELRDEVTAGTPFAVEGLRRLEQAG
ncbi:tetratricopeptide repeat protein [Dactylosporangium cerinum]|uniref:Tetratricopeptide repeat protein n=1 Tax=Dactylosporangium cerinum TaxID=1434730 RepID=A0ABV9WDH9_9ACTN